MDPTSLICSQRYGVKTPCSPYISFWGGRGCYRASFIFIVYSKRLGYKLIFFFLKEVKNFISGGEASVSLWYFFSFGYKL